MSGRIATFDRYVQTSSTLAVLTEVLVAQHGLSTDEVWRVINQIDIGESPDRWLGFMVGALFSTRLMGEALEEGGREPADVGSVLCGMICAHPAVVAAVAHWERQEGERG